MGWMQILLRLARSMNESQAKVFEAWVAALQTQMRTSCTACTCLSSSFVIYDDICMSFLGTYLSSILGRLSLRTVVVQSLLKFHIRMIPFLPRWIPFPHFKCLIAGGPWPLFGSRHHLLIHFSRKGIPNFTGSLSSWKGWKCALVHFHYLPKTCQDSAIRKSSQMGHGSVVFVALLSQHYWKIRGVGKSSTVLPASMRHEMPTILAKVQVTTVI